jgi:non-specific serine/threonine protein kinase
VPPGVVSPIYRFGHFELQPVERRLLVDGQPVRLGPHAFDLLVVLAERSGHLLTKDDLLERVWPKVVVEENTLQVHVSALRKVLGANAIATVPGRGYRFVPDVDRVEGPDPSEPPVALPHKPVAHNLPYALTSFIGRLKEMGEVEQLLASTRLLTLTGAGGCGKTRLSLQVAGRMQERYEDGIWLVELAPLGDPSLVPKAVADALGVKEQAGKNIAEAVADCLSPQHVLLVLDNAEHLLTACIGLVDLLLRRCARLTILVTSRERLGVTGEVTYRVPSLSVPDPRRDAEALACEAAQLFIDRARLQRPHFCVTSENVAAFASICRRLDGIPLAIELAAPRLRSMSVEELSQRLDHRFGLLTGGSRLALPRHQTLHSMIDWSFALLSDAEKAVLVRASIFSDGWTLDAAEQVCHGEGVDSADMLDLLTSLEDKSLILAEEHDGTTRYGMLETVRHFARDRLLERGEEVEVRRRHLEWFQGLAQAAEPLLTGADQRDWLDRLEAEHGNLRSALAWSATPAGHAVAGLRLAGSIFWFWYVRGHPGEGRRWLSALLAATSDAQDPPARSKALRGAGVLAFSQGDYPAVDRYCRESLSISRALGDQAGVARSLNTLGLTAQAQGDYSEGRVLLEQALALRRELGDQWGIAASLTNLGRGAYVQGDHATAKAFYEEALQVNRQAGDLLNVAVILHNLGHLAYQEGDHPAARVLLEESLAGCRKLNDRTLSANSLHVLGLVALAQGDHRAAFGLQEEVLALSREVGDRVRTATALEALGSVALAMQQPARAIRVWSFSQRLREDIGAPMTPVDEPAFRRQLADAHAAMGHTTSFDAAWEEGRRMTLDEAALHALDTDGGADDLATRD